MATKDTATDRPTAHPTVVDDIQQRAKHNTRLRKLLQYLQGDRTTGEIDMQQDIVPALQDLNGLVAMRFSHTGKTEYVWPATETDAVSSCYYDDGRSHMENVPISRDELEDWRDTPEPSDFLPAENVDHLRPERALGGDD